MKNQTVLITGALTGIGRATAAAFAREGAKIVVSGRHEDKGRELVAELRGLGAEAEFIQADVRQEEDVKNLIEKTVKRFGRLDVAVNNAGTEGKSGPIIEQTAEAYSQVFDTNVFGVLLSLKHEMRAMREQKAGSIVNMSSVVGHLGFPGASIYVASKHAVEGLTKVAALEGVEFGIRVNSVAPGPIDTEMVTRFTGTPENKAALISGVPMNRMGQSEEVAAVILFLASSKAAFITGASIAVDGGVSLGFNEQKSPETGLQKAA